MAYYFNTPLVVVAALAAVLVMYSLDGQAQGPGSEFIFSYTTSSPPLPIIYSTIQGKRKSSPIWVS